MANIVLTSDASLLIKLESSPIKSLFITLPNSVVPLPLFKKICQPLDVNDQGVPYKATTALRTVEAIVRSSNLKTLDTKIVSPNHLKKQINEKTKIVGVSAEDPLGISPATVLFTSMFGGRSINNLMFEKLMNEIKKLKRKIGFKVIFGGPGAWQFRTKSVAQYYGIDYVFRGEAEEVLPSFLTRLINDETDVNGFEIFGRPARPEKIPKLFGPVNTKIIEISRGCGRGCKFCPEGPIGMMRSLPLDKILHDARIHVKAGFRSITLQSEDAFRYGSRDFLTDWEALSNLIDQLHDIGIKDINFTSTTFTAFYNDPDLTRKITQKLNRHKKKENVIQVGLETASSRLMKIHFANKCSPLFKPSEWPEVIMGAMKIMKEQAWLPVSTVIMGLPGEEDEDVLETIQLIKRLNRSWGFFIPFVYVPMKIYSLPERNRFIVENMTQYHWTLMEELIKHDVLVLEQLSRHPIFGKNNFYRQVNTINETKLLQRILLKLLHLGLFRIYKKKSKKK
ncbi:MAG: B12-binding domain-containing radical SAM protein [Candidatus Helarchaeales archaeon]